MNIIPPAPPPFLPLNSKEFDPEQLLGEKRPFILPPTCSCCIGSPMFMNRSSDMRFSSNHSCLLSFHTEKFDLALTARDQAILEAGLKVSDRTKGALRCDLTRLYPALPMTSPLYNGFLSISTDGSSFPAISSPYAVIPAMPSGLPVCDVSDQDTFFVVASEFEKNHYLYFYAVNKKESTNEIYLICAAMLLASPLKFKLKFFQYSVQQNYKRLKHDTLDNSMGCRF
ncbi:hypothetical protein ACTXT7_008508 [Hymenolepis weldensis]